ncbi:MAG: hypothetical protein AB7F96_16870 [Beijerinckiaceae bacterium]
MSDNIEAKAAASAFCDYVGAMAEQGKLAEIPQDVLRDVLTSAIKAYAAQVEAIGEEFPPVDTGKVNATEGVIAVCAIIRAIDLNMFDVSMWYNRAGGRG